MHEACLSRAFPRQRPAEGASNLSPPPRFLKPPPPALAATTLVHSLFGGVLRSQIRCLRCGYESNTYEPCVDVSLDVAADDEGGGGGGGGGFGNSPHRQDHQHRPHHSLHQQQQQHKKHKQHFNFHLSSHASAPAATTLQGALSRFTAGERLEGENAYACPGCRERSAGSGSGRGKKGNQSPSSSSSPPRSPAVKAITLHSTPRVLVLQLKRFEYHAAGRKISRKVDFGTDLDVSPFTSAAADSRKKPFSKQQQQQGLQQKNGSKKRKAAAAAADDDEIDKHGDADDSPPVPAASTSFRTRYSLSGVLVHSGHSVSSGHYTCFVKAGNGLWHGCDDDHVSQVSERVVLAQRAYILVYVRSDGGGGGGGEEEVGARFGNGNVEAFSGEDFASSPSLAAAPVPPLPVPALANGGDGGGGGGSLAERRAAPASEQGKAGEGGGGGNNKASSPAKRYELVFSSSSSSSSSFRKTKGNDKKKRNDETHWAPTLALSLDF